MKRILNTSKINAFSLPNGFIFLTRGDYILNDDQLSILLGHEIAHILMSHRIELISLNNFLNLILLPPLILIWSTFELEQRAFIVHLCFTSITTLYFNYYSRSLEIEADYFGSLLSAKACFDVRQIPLLWNKMKKEMNYLGLPDTLKHFFSSHPSFEKRKSFAKSIIPKLVRFREFQRCPKLKELKEDDSNVNFIYTWKSVNEINI